MAMLFCIVAVLLAELVVEHIWDITIEQISPTPKGATGTRGLKQSGREIGINKNFMDNLDRKERWRGE